MSGDNSMNFALSDEERIWIRAIETHCSESFPLLALLRVRNEELILEDTLDHLASFADLICVYEDASNDNTREILKSHPKVSLIIENDKWLAGIDNRLISETRHRALLLEAARSHYKFRWCMCCDADERYVGEIREFVTAADGEKQPDAVRIKLFDAYMTEGDDHPISQGVQLLNFRRYFGPERRDVLMLWRNADQVIFKGIDSREPVIQGAVQVNFFCQHYGKSLSYEQWESTCSYYVNNFPWETYGKKWDSRKGKALHTESDFGRPLYEWGKQLFENAVTI